MFVPFVPPACGDCGRCLSRVGVDSCLSVSVAVSHTLSPVSVSWRVSVRAMSDGLPNRHFLVCLTFIFRSRLFLFFVCMNNGLASGHTHPGCCSQAIGGRCPKLVVAETKLSEQQRSRLANARLIELTTRKCPKCPMRVTHPYGLLAGCTAEQFVATPRF